MNGPSTVLEQICLRKSQHVSEKKTTTPIDTLKETCKSARPTRNFVEALKNSEAPAIIAEIKKASPSKGLIREDFDPPQLAKAYKEGGAACLSVLTDEPYFQGNDDYLGQAKAAVPMPILRKDFMIDPYQIYESRALGADCILLIMAALSDEIASELYELTKELSMDALIEVHNEEELARALKFSPNFIGVNNRNLKTMEVSFQTSKDLAPMMPDDVFKISESGIHTHNDIKKLSSYGYQGFLIGESLMKQENVTTGLKALRNIHQ